MRMGLAAATLNDAPERYEASWQATTSERPAVYGTEGHRFESCRARFPKPAPVAGFFVSGEQAKGTSRRLGPTAGATAPPTPFPLRPPLLVHRRRMYPRSHRVPDDWTFAKDSRVTVDLALSRSS
jgi:hypothetical protein